MLVEVTDRDGFEVTRRDILTVLDEDAEVTQPNPKAQEFQILNLRDSDVERLREVGFLVKTIHPWRTILAIILLLGTGTVGWVVSFALVVILLCG